MGSGENPNLNQTKQAALILGFVGAFLDIYSGYSFLAESTTTSNDMGVIMTVHNSSALAWGIGSVGAWSNFDNHRNCECNFVG